MQFKFHGIGTSHHHHRSNNIKASRGWLLIPIGKIFPISNSWPITLYLSPLLKVKCCYCVAPHNTTDIFPTTRGPRSFSRNHQPIQIPCHRTFVVSSSSRGWVAVLAMAIPKSPPHPLRWCRSTKHCEIVKSCGSFSEPGTATRFGS